MWSKKHCDNNPHQDLKDVISIFIQYIQFHKIPATVLMQEVNPLGLVPPEIIMNALAYQVVILQKNYLYYLSMCYIYKKKKKLFNFNISLGQRESSRKSTNQSISFMRGFVAGRSNQRRPHKTLPPRNEATGSQHVGPVVSGSVRQLHDLEHVKRLRRRVGSEATFW